MTKIEFHSLVLRQTSLLKTRALNFAHNAHDANDLIQDTMLKAINSYDKFDEGTNLQGWLHTIMRNTFINNYHSVVRTNTYVIKSDEISCPNLIYSSTKNQGEAKFIMDDIKRAMDKLPDNYYLPFTMYFEGYKYREISDYLTIPIGTVKTRIHSARILLKQNLKAYNDIKKTIYAEQ